MTTATLDSSDQRIAAQRGIGGVHLIWSLRCQPMPGPVAVAVPYELTGAVSLDTGRGPIYLTRCWSERPLWFRDGHGADVTLGMDLRPEQIAEIEDLRAGSHLTLLINFVVTAVDGTVDRPVLDGNQARLLVQSAAWADMLQQVGIAERMLLLVPAPPATASRDLHEAWKAWQTAREAVDGGRWSDAVGATRRVYELLHVTAEPPTEVPRKRSKEERWQSVAAALYRLSCAPLHADPVTLDMEWTRDDAVAAVAHAGAVLRTALGAIKA